MDDNGIPQSFYCPLTQEIMQDPVQAADGYSYERTAIEKWIKEKGTSPMTRQSLSLESLVPNRSLAETISLEKKKNTEPKPEKSDTNKTSTANLTDNNNADPVIFPQDRDQPFMSSPLVIPVMTGANNVSVLNMETVIERLQQHKAGYEIVEGKDIVFVFGKTGSGKTTTILYLSGKNMYRKTVMLEDDIPDEVIECENPIPGFSIGHRAKSETQTVRTHTCPLTELNFCDSPGLDDTAGVEIDIANGVGISNTILHANSARIVLVMDGKTLGLERGQVLIEFIHLITRFISNIEDHLDSIAFLFTRDVNYVQLLREVVKLAGEQHIKENPQTFKVVTYLKDYLKKHQALAVVNPDDPQKREKQVELLKSLAAIPSNPEIFGFPLSYKATTMLNEQCKNIAAKAQWALSKKDVPELQKTLDDLKLLAEEVHTPQLKDQYTECTAWLSQTLTQLIAEIRKRLSGREYANVKQGMEHLRNMIQLSDFTDIDIKQQYQSLKSEINTTAATLEKEICSEKSFMIIGQKLGVLSGIQEHLAAHLVVDFYNRAKQSVQLQIEELNKGVTESLTRIDSADFDANVTTGLAQNLELLTKVADLTGHLSEYHCRLYSEKIASLLGILEKNFDRFTSFLASDVKTTEQIASSYKIIQLVESNRNLSTHIPGDKRKFTQIFNLLSEHCDVLRQRLETQAHECNYVAVKETLTTLRAFLKVDSNFGPNFEGKKLSHTLDLLEKQLKKTQEEVLEASKLVLLRTEGSGSIALIQSKLVLLQNAKELEKDLSDTGLISQFLASLRDRFAERAHQLSTEARTALKNGNFAESAKIIGALVVFESLQEFEPEIRVAYNSFSKEYCDLVQQIQVRIPLHCKELMFRELGKDYVDVKGLSLIEDVIASNSQHSILSELKESIISSVTQAWSDAYEKTTQLLKLPTPTAVAEMVKLIRKLHAIKDSELTVEDLQACNPATDLAAVIKKLRATMLEIESNTKIMIVQDQLDAAEKNLELAKAMTELSEFVDLDMDSMYSNLAASFSERKFNLTQQIPDKLKQRRFNAVADIFRALKKSGSTEYENSFNLVYEYFAQIQSKIRRLTSPEAISSAFDTLELLTKAKVLEEVDQEGFNISGLHAKLVTEISNQLEKRQKNFFIQLHNHNFKMAYSILQELEDYPQAPEIKQTSTEKLEELRKSFQQQLIQVPQDVQHFVRNGDIARIERTITNLESFIDYEEEDVHQLLNKIMEILQSEASNRLAQTRSFAASHNLKDAEKELNELENLVRLKWLAPLKAQIQTLYSDVESLRQDLFNWNTAITNPQKMAEQFDIARNQSYHEYKKQLEQLENKLGQRLEKAGSGLQAKPPHVTAIEETAHVLCIVEKIVEAFHKSHPEFCDKVNTMKEKLLKNLRYLYDDLKHQLHLAQRHKQWEEVEKNLKITKQIVSSLEKYLPGSIQEEVKKQEADIRNVINSLKANWDYLQKLDFLKPVPLAELNKVLIELKQNDSIQYYSQNSDNNNVFRYQDAVQLVVRTVTEQKSVVDRLWNEEKYEPIAQLLENLKQGSKLAEHDAIYKCFSSNFDNFITSIKGLLLKIVVEAKELFKTKQLEKLEPVLVKYRSIEKELGRIPELFPTTKNEIVEDMQRSVEKQVEEFFAKFRATQPPTEEVAHILLQLKKLISTISNTQLGAFTYTAMNNILNYLAGLKDFDFYKLGAYLSASGPLGRDIVEGDSFPQFKAFIIAKITEITARMTPEDALNEMKKLNNLSNSEVEALKTGYDRFHKQFQELLDRYLLAPPEELDTLVESIILQMLQYRQNRNWSNFKHNLPDILAKICAVWSVSSSASFYAQTNNKNSVLRPHPVQVLSILRILEFDASHGYIEAAKVFFMGDKLRGHLVQIGTGEGKSIILGILSTMLALAGYRISTVCYSQYLSTRDYNSFKDLFTRFKVVDKIQYSTLAQMAGQFINEEGDIRAYTKAFIEGKPTRTTPTPKSERILLIDEVDVFFSREFYGATYNPSVILKNAHVSALLEHIWKNRNHTSLHKIKGTKEFKSLIALYPKIAKIIESSIIRMIDAATKFNDPPYSRIKNEFGQTVIGYKEGGTVSTSIQHGYKTCFAYLNERDAGNITNEVAQEHLGLAVNCGQFSYAEVPKSFSCILGVTGTLRTLGSFETEVKNEEYQIKKSTYTPSIYGDSQLSWKEKDDVFVEKDSAHHFRKILDSSIERQKYGQAVLVFFETDQKMNEFCSSYGKGLSVNKITEDVENLDFYVKKSTLTGTITLLTRVFGRGVDFVCYDDIVEKAGGIHVIQTFLSEDVSEEIQIRGRTARQGKKGSYTLILNQEDIVKQFAIQPEVLEEKKKSAELYQFLHSSRVSQFDRKSADRKGIIERSLALHRESLQFRSNLVSNRDHKSIVSYLERQNPSIKAKSRTICLSDATGSMHTVWRNAQTHITEMIRRITEIGGAGKSELKWIAYRDYSDAILLQQSEWSSNPSELEKFIAGIECTGGGDTPEAVEMGLQAVNNTEGVTRVILIADAEPHLEGKGNVVAYHKKTLETDYIEQAKLLADKHIPVYCFYMNRHRPLVQSFEQIANITGGKATIFRDTNTLIDVISESVLDDIGGEELVLEYRKTYHS